MLTIIRLTMMITTRDMATHTTSHIPGIITETPISRTATANASSVIGVAGDIMAQSDTKRHGAYQIKSRAPSRIVQKFENRIGENIILVASDHVAGFAHIGEFGVGRERHKFGNHLFINQL